MSSFTRSAFDFFIVFFVTLCVLGIFISDVFIFRSKASTYTDENLGNIIKIATKDGTKISAMHIENPKSEYTVLVSHGNSEDIRTSHKFAKELVAHGFSAIVYDYYGYGTSEGKPSESNSYLAVGAVYDYLTKQKHIPSRKIISYGHSLGSALASYVAEKQPVGGLVIEGAFTTAFRVLTIVPLLPFDKFRTISRIQNIDMPKLIIHGKKDNVIQFWHGEELYEKANPPKDFFWLEEGSHDNIRKLEPKKYWQKWYDLVKTMESFKYDK